MYTVHILFTHWPEVAGDVLLSLNNPANKHNRLKGQSIPIILDAETAPGEVVVHLVPAHHPGILTLHQQLPAIIKGTVSSQLVQKKTWGLNGDHLSF